MGQQGGRRNAPRDKERSTLVAGTIMLSRDYRSDADNLACASKNLATRTKTTKKGNNHDKDEDNEEFLLEEWRLDGQLHDAQRRTTFA